MTWPIVSLADLGAPVEYACVGGPFGSELTRAHYVEAPGVPVIRGGNLADTGFVDADFVFVSRAKAATLRANIARPGDIVFTQRGTIGQVAVIPKRPAFPEYVLSQSQMKLTLDEKRADPRFVVHYFRSPIVLNHLERNTLATGVPHINLSILRTIPVPLPPLPEQQRIGSILDKADAIRGKRAEAITLTEQLLRSTFLEMFGDPVTNPKKWPTRTLGSACKDDLRYGTSVRCSPTRSDGDMRVLRIPNVVGGRIEWSDLKYASLEESERARLLLRRGDILFVRSNGNPEYIGRCAVFDDDQEAAFASYLIRARLVESESAAYVHAALSTTEYRGVLAARARTTAGNFNISAEALRELVIPMPPPRLRRRFADIAGTIQRSITQQHMAATGADVLMRSLTERAFREELS